MGIQSEPHKPTIRLWENVAQLWYCNVYTDVYHHFYHDDSKCTHDEYWARTVCALDILFYYASFNFFLAYMRPSAT